MSKLFVLTPVYFQNIFFPNSGLGKGERGVQPVVVDTTIMQLPVNCVLDGQQREPIGKLMKLDGAITGPLRGVFKE